jgi:nitrite reductase/ring-hydroxylating ferredoxin subunit
VHFPLLAPWRRQRPRRRFDDLTEPELAPDGEGLDICSAAELDRRGRVIVSLPDSALDVLVVKTAEGVYAVDNYCPHLGAALETGLVSAETITCAVHGLRFDLGSGRCVTGRRARTPSLTTMRAWITDGRVLLAVPDARGRRRPGRQATSSPIHG